MFKIMYKYKGGRWEEIDSTDSRETAEYLLSEYRLAYRGHDCQLKIEEE